MIDLNTLKKNMYEWLIYNSAAKDVGDVPMSCVINSLQGLMLEAVTEGMVIIARNATSDDIWEVTAKLNALSAWSDECVAKLGELQ